MVLFAGLRPANAASQELIINPGVTVAVSGGGVKQFATIDAAQEYVQGPDLQRENQEVTYCFLPGLHQFTSTWTIGANDSAKNGSTTRYSSCGKDQVFLRLDSVVGEELVRALSSEERRRRFPHAGDLNLYEVALPDYLAKSIPKTLTRRGYSVTSESVGHELVFVGDTQLALATWPDSGWATIDQVIEEDIVRGSANASGRGGKFKSGALQAAFGSAEAVWIYGYLRWDWYDEYLPAKLLDGENGIIHLLEGSDYGLKSGGRFKVRDSIQALNTDGEYVIDRTRGVLSFGLSRPIGQADVSVAALKQPILRIEDAIGIEIDGLTFERGRSGGIEVKDSREIRLKDVRVRDIGGVGVRVSRGSDVLLDDVVVRNCGLTGIEIEGGDRRSLRSAGHVVTDSVIEFTGRRIAARQPAIRLSGVGHTIKNNIVRHTLQSAIMYLGNNHRIEQNRIAMFCLEGSDCGGIYSGRDWTSRGTVIYANLIDNSLMPGHPKDISAIYFDDLMGGQFVESNVVKGVYRGVLIGGGRTNFVRGNVFQSVRVPYSLDARGLHWGRQFRATLEARMRQAPIASAEWRRQYPDLSRLERDTPMAPKYNDIQGNVFLNCGSEAIDPIARIYFREGKNWVTGQYAEDDGDKASDLMTDEEIRAKLPEWKPLPPNLRTH